jgi:hypothetical protein
MEEKYLMQLEMVRVMERLELDRTLRLRHILVEDSVVGKSVIFVFDPFHYTLAEMIRNKVKIGENVAVLTASFVT